MSALDFAITGICICIALWVIVSIADDILKRRRDEKP